MPPELHYDPSKLDLEQVLVDQEGIRRVNPQRFEMEQLTAIVHLDNEQHLIAGYKDVRPDEFWTRGHMPGYPLLPGVLMCEAAAQLAAYYTFSQGLLWRHGERALSRHGQAGRSAGPGRQGRSPAPPADDLQRARLRR